MATRTGRGRCTTCDKEKRVVICSGCSKLFCYEDLPDHRQQLSQQLNHIEVNRDVFRQTLTEQTTDPKKHSLIKQIHQWEKDSIRKIQQTAKECQQQILQHTTEHIHVIETKLAKLTGELKQTRQDNDFNEIDLHEFRDKLKKLADELDKPSGVSIKNDSESLVNKISVVVHSQQEFAEPGTCNQLACEGRPCAKCHMCRDWHFTGNHDTWDWIINWKNLKNEEWNRFVNDRIYKSFTRRNDGATCRLHLYPYLGYDRDGYYHLCVCELH